MLSQLLKEKKKPRAKLLPRSPRAKGRKGRAHLLQTLRMKSIPTLEPPKFSSEDEDNSENRSSHSKRISKLEQYLEALENKAVFRTWG